LTTASEQLAIAWTISRSRIPFFLVIGDLEVRRAVVNGLENMVAAETQEIKKIEGRRPEFCLTWFPP
jgi:hypothetical protein